MELEEFKTQYIRYARAFKVTDSWGVYDAYKWLRKHGWLDIGRPLKEKEFYAIIRGVNNLLAENLGNGIPVSFPHRMGELELRKFQRSALFKDGKLKVTYPIDWSKTWKLWYDDAEAMEKKFFILDEQKWVYRVRYCKHDATYENKIFYNFALNRKIKKKLKENIKDQKIDTLW